MHRVADGAACLSALFGCQGGAASIPRVPTLTSNRLLRFFSLGALYFAQGVPWGFIAVGYVVFLTDQGLGNEAVGWAIGLGYIPWSFKIVFGPVLDRFPSVRFGRRRPYIIGAEFLMGLSLLALLFVDPATQLALVGGILFVHNTCAALQDVAVDALAVDILPQHERGRANSIMWAAKSGGVAVGGGAGTVLAKYAGWPALFITMAVIIWLVMLVPLLVRERDAEDGEQAAAVRLNLTELKRSFSFAAPFIGALIALLTPAGYAMVNTVYTRMLRAEFKLEEEAIATLSGVVDPIAGVVGALLGGVLADRFGMRRMIGFFMAGIAMVLAVFAVMQGRSIGFGFLVGYTIALNLMIYAYNAATLGFFMTLSNPAIGATQFAIFMAMTNFCYALTAPAGGRIADQFGYTTLFATAAVIQILTIALLPFCDPRKAEARFRKRDDAPAQKLAA